MSNKANSISMAQLYVDFLKYVQFVQALNGQCNNKDGFRVWDCCDAHRLLAKQSEEQHKRGAKLSPVNPEKGDPGLLSPKWWQDNGFMYPSDLDAVIQD